MRETERARVRKREKRQGLKRKRERREEREKGDIFSIFGFFPVISVGANAIEIRSDTQIKFLLRNRPEPKTKLNGPISSD